jgi:hypothetical protein
MVIKQQLLFVEEWETSPGGVPRAKPVALTEKPNNVWTLYGQTKPDSPPALPFYPQHLSNAFLEDEMHDWKWTGGAFRYFSRLASSPVWLLLEYK